MAGTLSAVGVLLFVGVIVVIGVAAYYSWQAKVKRREAMNLFAVKHGLDFSIPDPFGIDRAYDFHLFSMGEGRGCENVLSGVWQGLPVQEADYWYYTESTDSKGHTSRSYSHFSVAVVQLEALVPGVRVERENLLTRLADHMGMSDIEFESEEFNRRFNVKSKDPEFAFKLLDARMMEWLLGPAEGLCLEVGGGHALVYCKRLPPTRVAELFYAAKGFVEHVPRLVWNEYGKAAS
jgi:hypothetical protein